MCRPDTFAPPVSDLRERTTDKELDTQENDVWIASIALQHSFVLLTRDKKMARVLELAQKQFGLRYDIW
jgi:predicted nucleic acid-binding protein